MNGQPVLSPFNTIPNENSGMWLRLLLLFVADFVANILAFFTQMNLTTSLQTVILFPPEMNMTGIARKISWLRTPWALNSRSSSMLQLKRILKSSEMSSTLCLTILVYSSVGWAKRSSHNRRLRQFCYADQSWSCCRLQYAVGVCRSFIVCSQRSYRQYASSLYGTWALDRSWVQLGSQRFDGYCLFFVRSNSARWCLHVNESFQSDGKENCGYF